MLSATNIFLNRPVPISHSPWLTSSRRIAARLRDLRQQRRRPQNRPRHQMREVGDEHRERQEIARRLDLATIDVDEIRHRHERVEGDAERQDDVQRDEIGAPADGLDERRQVLGEKAVVLEEAQRREMEREAGPRAAAGERAAPRSAPDAALPTWLTMVDAASSAVKRQSHAA